MNAGVIPRLNRTTAGLGKELRIHPNIVPGADPMKALGKLELPAGDDGRRHVVVVDQFEEIFTLCQSVEKRKEFADAILALVRAGHLVFLTMRTDFDDKLPKLGDLYEKMKEPGTLVTVPPLSEDELRDAILKPATSVGLHIDEDVVNGLVSELVGQRAGLPLLQFCLMKLWEMRDRNLITWEAYEELGRGAGGAGQVRGRALQRDASGGAEHREADSPATGAADRGGGRGRAGGDAPAGAALGLLPGRGGEGPDRRRDRDAHRGSPHPRDGGRPGAAGSGSRGPGAELAGVRALAGGIAADAAGAPRAHAAGGGLAPQRAGSLAPVAGR